MNRRHRWGDPGIKRHEVFERDNWVCGICGEPVDRTLPPLDQMGATVDHIVPRIDGGLHRADNLQLAHMVCNARKRDRAAA